MYCKHKGHVFNNYAWQSFSGCGARTYIGNSSSFEWNDKSHLNGSVYTR